MAQLQYVTPPTLHYATPGVRISGSDSVGARVRFRFRVRARGSGGARVRFRLRVRVRGSAWVWVGVGASWWRTLPRLRQVFLFLSYYKMPRRSKWTLAKVLRVTRDLLPGRRFFRPHQHNRRRVGPVEKCPQGSEVSLLRQPGKRSLRVLLASQ